MKKNKNVIKKNLEETILIPDEIIAETEIITVEEMMASAVPSEEADLSSNDDVAEEILTSNLITDKQEIFRAVEAIIFAAPKAISYVKIKNLLTSFNFDTAELKEDIELLVQKFDQSGFQLVKVAGGFQFRTANGQSDILQKMLEDKPARLGKSALEVLAIVSYKQPVSRAEIDIIRGVDSGHLMKGLIEKNLVRSLGHAETPGRPLLYGTAPYFLEVFGLNSLDDLPAIEEFDREMRSSNDGLEGEESFSDDSVVLESLEDFESAGLFGRESPLAATPDRGSFDEIKEEHSEQPDFGLHERAKEELDA